MSTIVNPQPAQQRKVGMLLFIGIIFIPIIFTWLLLRKGHSTLARVLGFGWLAISLIFFAGTHEPTAVQQTSVSIRRDR